MNQLKSKDSKGYPHWVKIYPEYGHWMQKEDAVAIPWMHKFTRNKYPDRIVWKQDDVLHDRFYWLRVPTGHAIARSLVVASIKGQVIEIESETVGKATILLTDSMVNLDQPITVVVPGKTVFKGFTHRTISNLTKSLLERGDPNYLFSSEINISL